MTKAEEDKKIPEMDTEDDPLNEEAMTAESAKKMAERVADLKKLKGARTTSEGPAAEAIEISDKDNDNKDEDIENRLFAKCLA